MLSSSSAAVLYTFGECSRSCSSHHSCVEVSLLLRAFWSQKLRTQVLLLAVFFFLSLKFFSSYVVLICTASQERTNWSARYHN
jgi:hypothetical protein